jgi:hypothetical protein
MIFLSKMRQVTSYIIFLGDILLQRYLNDMLGGVNTLSFNFLLYRVKAFPLSLISNIDLTMQSLLPVFIKLNIMLKYTSSFKGNISYCS